MKKRMYKIMALAMTAAMVVPMAAQTTAFAADDKEITYWNIAVESPDKDIVTAAVDKFNKETESGYTVNQVAIQNDTYKEKLVIAMSSGECPDMYSSWSGGPMYEYIDSGFAQPIDDLLDQSDVKDKLLAAAIEQGSYNGHVYAIPYLNVSLAGIFYNKDMFEQYGLEEPKTLADLENICATLKENGITPFALANGSKWTGSMYFMSLAARYGGLEPFQNAVAGASEAIVVTTPEMSAIRDADRIIGLLESKEEIKSYKLLLNRVRPRLIKSNEMMGVDDVVEILSCPLVGIIPEDTGIITSTNKGEPIVNDENALAGKAYRNVAQRILGEEVPFLDLDEPKGFMAKIKNAFAKLKAKV